MIFIPTTIYTSVFLFRKRDTTWRRKWRRESKIKKGVETEDEGNVHKNKEKGKKMINSISESRVVVEGEGKNT
jgi:hypothetical protein